MIQQQKKVIEKYLWLHNDKTSQYNCKQCGLCASHKTIHKHVMQFDCWGWNSTDRRNYTAQKKRFLSTKLEYRIPCYVMHEMTLKCEM